MKILKNRDFNMTDFLVDDIEDVAKLKETNNCDAGSTAYVINTGELYIKKNDGNWIAKVVATNNNNTNDDATDTPTVIPVQKYAPQKISFSGGLYISDDGDGYDLSEELKNLDTSNVKDFYGAFSYVNNIKPVLDLSHFNTSKCENFAYMFQGLQVEYLDLSSFTFDSVYEAGGMFRECYNLTKLILGEGWLALIPENIPSPEGLSVGGGVPGGGWDIMLVPLFEDCAISNGDGYIYVPDDLVDQFKVHPVFADFANQIKPKSELV